MVAKGNTDKHRQSYCGMKGVVETEKWGRDKAVERYGKLDSPNMKPADASYPQFKNDQRGPDWADDHANDWIRGKNEDATTRPGYVPGGGRAKRGGR